MLNKNDFNLREGANGSWVISIAVPGFTKQDISCAMVGETVHIVGELPAGEYSWRGIRSSLNDYVHIGTNRKIDLVTLNNGILDILVSNIVSGKIEIQ